MTKQEATQRLCALMGVVQSHLGWQNASDCFCGDSELTYQNDGLAIEYIEKLVLAAIDSGTLRDHTPYGCGIRSCVFARARD